MLCVLAVPPPHIYIGGRGRGAARGAPSRSNPTWAPPTSQPPPFHKCRKGKEREGGEKDRGRPNPPLSSPLPSFLILLFRPIWGRTSPLGAGMSLSWPIRPISLSGV